MATAQNTAIQLANQVLNVGAQLESLLAQVNALVQQYNDQGSSNIWQALATCAKNSDGSLGTADGAPVSGHPINTAIVTALNQAVAATSLMSAVGIMQDFQTFMNGTGAAPQVNRRQALNQNLVS